MAANGCQEGIKNLCSRYKVNSCYLLNGQLTQQHWLAVVCLLSQCNSNIQISEKITFQPQ